MMINYNFDHVFYPGADMVLNTQTLREMLEMLIRVNLVFLNRARQLGYAVPSVYRSGVTYRRQDYWEPIPTLYKRQWGDCKSIPAALIAEQRFQGIHSEPAFRWAESEKGDNSLEWHILVQLGNQFDDPCRKLGMGANEVARFYAAGH